jgi:hypothetical protein
MFNRKQQDQRAEFERQGREETRRIDAAIAREVIKQERQRQADEAAIQLANEIRRRG